MAKFIKFTNINRHIFAIYCRYYSDNSYYFAIVDNCEYKAHTENDLYNILKEITH